MLPVCILFIPLLLVLRISNDNYVAKNTSKDINNRISYIPTSNEEVANYLTKFLAILWPHIFSQERVEQFKNNLQWVLDSTKIPYIDGVTLKEIQLGDTAPQITFIRKPDKPKPANKSMLFEVQAIYYPSFVLNALVKVNNALDVNVSFNNLTVTLDTLIQFEFKEDPDMPYIPFWSALDFSLMKPPGITGFDVTVFKMTSVFNRDDLKKHMSQAAANALWLLCGVPSGFLWERVTGKWKIAKVFGKTKMKRSSMKYRDMIRDSILKKEALDYIAKYKISKPVVIVTRSLCDKQTTTYFFQLICEFSDSYNIQAFEQFIDQVGSWETSSDELRSIMSLTFEFLYGWFDFWSKRIIKSKKSPTKEEEARIGKIMTYINFISNQSKVHPQVAQEMNIEKRVDELFILVSSTQEKLFKLRGN